MITDRSLVYSLLVILFHFLLGNASTLDIFPAHSQQTLESCKINKIYQLGDSISDTGNLIREFPIGSSSSCSRLPYGQDFCNHVPTGRFSNGLLMIDYIATAAGLPFLNPCKSVNANFTTGVNFAVSGSTALSSHTLQSKNITSSKTNSSLDVQLHWMSTYFNSICPNNKDCAQKLRHALFIVGEIGGNDYNRAYQVGKSTEEVKSIVPEVVQAITNAAKSVIPHGGVQLIIPGDFPAGCFPVYLTKYGTDDVSAYDENHCKRDRNNISEYHNHLIQQAIKELQQEYPNVTIIYGDYYNAFFWLIQNAQKLGFEENSTQKACCGVGGNYNFDPSRMCGHPEATVCADPDVRISWDGIHLTQAAYKNMAEWLLTAIVPQLQCSASISTGVSSS